MVAGPDEKPPEEPKVVAFKTLMGDMADALKVQVDFANRLLGAKEMKAAEFNWRQQLLLNDNPKISQWTAKVTAVEMEGLADWKGVVDDPPWDEMCEQVRALSDETALAVANVELAKLALTGFLGEAIYARAPKLEVMLAEKKKGGVASQAIKAVADIAADISDRAGLGDIFYDLDIEVKGEIIDAWTTIIQEAIEAAQ